jgi:hypothetical protein
MTAFLALSTAGDQQHRRQRGQRTGHFTDLAAQQHVSNRLDAGGNRS